VDEGSPVPLKAGSTVAPSGRIRLLGPVDVVTGGAEIGIGRHARTMLAVLAVNAGRVVSTDLLVEVLWGETVPRTAAHALHVHASNLRKLLPGEVVLDRTPGGYRLRAPDELVDGRHFEILVERARAALSSGDTASARRNLDDALALWRGSPLADVPGERFAEPEIRRWEETRHLAEEELVEVALTDGRLVEATNAAESMVRDQPFRERRWTQLMVALYRSGRQTDALARYHELVGLLRDEIGVPPGPQVRALAGEIIRHDASLGGAATPATPVTRFARGPAGRLAYQVIGDGPGDLVLIPGFGGNVEIRWEEPNLARLYRRLARSARLVLMDRRGTGLSDRDTGVPPVAAQVHDVLAVMDAAGVERAALFGVMDGGAIGLLCAARNPARVSGVVTYATWPASAMFDPTSTQVLTGTVATLDAGLGLDAVITMMAPSRVDDAVFTAWFGRYVRLAAGSGGTTEALRRFREVDIRADLVDVTVPVLALAREGDRFVPAACAHAIAAGVQDGTAVLLPGDDSVIWAGDVDVVAAQIEEFLFTGEPR
jgi:DNA-binding SARP family transcriptional activator/pimeloyl-ACP methyl ester carboxylesterase